MRSSTPGLSGDVWIVTKTAAGRSFGRPAAICVTASRAPVEPPTTTIRSGVLPATATCRFGIAGRPSVLAQRFGARQPRAESRTEVSGDAPIVSQNGIGGVNECERGVAEDA